jgi:predicted GIY-YIG superfamily endonuclease
MSSNHTIPTEQLLQEVEHPTKPGVYVLELDSPDVCLGKESLHAHARFWWWAGYQDTHPDDVAVLQGTQRLLYVGAAQNLQARLETHVQADVRKSAWLSVYPPTKLVTVSVTSSVVQAFDRETQLAYRMADTTPETTTVVCNGQVMR